MLLDLKFSIGTLGIGSGAFVAALYGMNLKNFIEESNMGFWGVTGWCVVFAGIVCTAIAIAMLPLMNKLSASHSHAASNQGPLPAVRSEEFNTAG